MAALFMNPFPLQTLERVNRLREPSMFSQVEPDRKSDNGGRALVTLVYSSKLDASPENRNVTISTSS